MQALPWAPLEALDPPGSTPLPTWFLSPQELLAWGAGLQPALCQKTGHQVQFPIVL